jgi:hypothetical protein
MDLVGPPEIQFWMVDRDFMTKLQMLDIQFVG